MVPLEFGPAVSRVRLLVIPPEMLIPLFIEGKETHAVCAKGVPPEAMLIAKMWINGQVLGLVFEHPSFAPIMHGQLIPVIDTVIDEAPPREAQSVPNRAQRRRPRQQRPAELVS